MASLQESQIASLTMGRGNNGYPSNTVFGYEAAKNTTTASFTTAIGHRAGCSITDQCWSTFIGYNAGCGNNGSDNVFVGSNSGISNNGSFNVVVGKCAGIGYLNLSVAIGGKALACNSNYCNTVAIGYAAGRAPSCNSVNIGNAAGFASGYQGRRSVNIGQKAGEFAYCSNNVTIGACAGRFGTQVNTTQIGFYAYGGYNTNNKFVLGRYSANNSYIYVAWTNVSDSRDKTNVQTLPDNLGLNFIRKLRPVSFKYDTRNSYMFKCGFEYGDKDGTLKKNECNYGFLAQEIEQAANDLNVKFDGVSYDTYNDKYGVKMLELLSPIVKSIQELNNELDNIEKQIG